VDRPQLLRLDRAWRLLLDARDALLRAEAAGGLGEKERAAAWDGIHIAEGSDWYWWYGDDRTSGMDDVFDDLFRRHLANVYRAIGLPPPHSLASPIGGSHPAPVRQPTGLLEVRVDGRRTSFFEWLSAGRFRVEDEAGSMQRAQSGTLEEIAFGFDSTRFFLALDFGRKPARIFDGGGAVRIHFLAPQERELVVYGAGRMELAGAVYPSVAVDEILELSVPWAALGATVGDELGFYVGVERAGTPAERFPRSFAIHVRVPDPEFDQRIWTV
jgi:hypothetical protein